MTKPPAMPEQVWLIYAKKGPELRRLSFFPSLSAGEKESGCVAEPYVLAALQSAQPAEVSDEEIDAAGHRTAWRYKHSSDPAHSSTYTFNRACLLQFARAILALRPAQQATPEPVADSIHAMNNAAYMTAIANLTAERDTLREEVGKLHEAIDAFCEGNRWAVDAWKNRPDIKPLFDIDTARKATP